MKKSNIKTILIASALAAIFLSISINIIQIDFNNNFKIKRLWNQLINGSICFASIVKARLLSIDKYEITYKKLPKLRPKFDIRDKVKVNNWNDLGVGIESKWPIVPLESALFEFLVDYYQGIGKNIENLIYDLLNAKRDHSKKFISTEIVNDLLKDNLTIKFMQTLIINRWYSMKIESLREFGRQEKKQFNFNCVKINDKEEINSWTLIIYKNSTFDIYCDLSEVIQNIFNKNYGSKNVRDYDMNLSKIQFEDENIIGEQNVEKTVDFNIIAYIDFSNENSYNYMKNLIHFWEKININSNSSNRIIIRYCDKNKIGENFEYLTGYEVLVKKKRKNLDLDELKSMSVNELSLHYNGQIEKTYKDYEYEEHLSIYDRAINMENVINIDGKVELDCMKDIGTNIVSISKRFEDPLNSILNYLENFGSYQVALCNSIKENNTLNYYKELNKIISEGSTILSINGRLFSPKEINFFNIVPILKSLIFGRARLIKDNIDEKILIDSLSINGINENDELNIFLENQSNNLTQSKNNQLKEIIIKKEMYIQMEKGEIFNLKLISDFEKELEQDPTLLDELDWLVKKEYILSSSTPWFNSSPRTDWRITQSLSIKIKSFYKDITNIGDSQWADTPAPYEKVWFHKNLTNITYDQNNLHNNVEFSPWMMYRIYFTNQLRNAKIMEDYNLYDIMMEPENTLGQYLYPLENLPELFEKYPDNPGIYPIKAPLLNIIILCDPLDIECITIVISIINKKLPIKLNLILIDPEWINNRKPNYSMSFIYNNVTTEEIFQNKFSEKYEIYREEKLKENKCEQYYGKEKIKYCPNWLNKAPNINKENIKFNKYSKGSYALKLAISEIFGFLVSSLTIQGMFLGRAFLEMIAKNLPLLLEREFDLNQLQEFLEKFFSHFKIKAELKKVWEIIYSNNPNDSSYVNKATSYCRLKGFTSPGALINGYYVDINDLSIEEIIYGIAKKDQKIIMEGVKLKKINSEEQIAEYIFNNTNSIPIVFPPFTKSVKLNDWPYYGIKKEWEYIQEEIGYKLHKKYNLKNFTIQNNDYKINLNEPNKRKVIFNSNELSKLNYFILWDKHPEIKYKDESIKRKIEKTPWMTFIILVRSNKPGLMGLITLFDYWISTVSMQASLEINKYNDLLFNRRFSLLFIPEKNHKYSNSTDISEILQNLIFKIFEKNLYIKEHIRRPIIEKLRFAKWFIKLVIECLDNFNDNINQKIMEIFDTLSKSMNIELNSNKPEFEYQLILNIKKKLLKKFTSKDEEIYSFPYSSISNGKLKGYPIHLNYNLNKNKNETDNNSEYGKPNFKFSSISNNDCFENFTLGIVLNGVYLRVCPNTYPVYIRDDIKVNQFSSIHTVHLKLMEFAITIRMKQLVLLAENRLVNKEQDYSYRNKWSKLDPDNTFILLNEHFFVSNKFKIPSLFLLNDIYKQSHSSIKLHLPTIRKNENSLINVMAIVNPIMNNSVSILRLLNILHQLLEADVKIIYNPILSYKKISEIVLINSWRRYVFNYPKLIQYQEINKFSNKYNPKNLNESLYSNSNSIELNSSNKLYYLNSQMFANFNIQTNNHLELYLEQNHFWITTYQNVIIEKKYLNNNHTLSPSNIYSSGQVLFIYKLTGVIFEATLIDLQNQDTENVKEIEILNINSNYDFNHQIYYSLNEFKSFNGYLEFGNNNINIKYLLNNKTYENLASFQLKLFNPNIFYNDHVIISLTKLIQTDYEVMSRNNNDDNGLLKTLHILCVSNTKKEMNEYIIQSLLRIIDNGFLSGNKYYNKFIIYFDNKYISQIMKEYYDFKLYWKYYIELRFINIILPKWIPKLSIDNDNSFLNTILTLNHWISPQVKKLLIIDPFKVYVEKSIDNIMEINDSNSTFIFPKLDKEYLFDKELMFYSNFTTNIGLINMNKYRDTYYWIIKSYFELYNYFQYNSNFKLVDFMLNDIFFSYLSKYIHISSIDKNLVKCLNKQDIINNNIGNIVNFCSHIQFDSEDIENLKKLFKEKMF